MDAHPGLTTDKQLIPRTDLTNEALCPTQRRSRASFQQIWGRELYLCKLYRVIGSRCEEPSLSPSTAAYSLVAEKLPRRKRVIKYQALSHPSSHRYICILNTTLEHCDAGLPTSAQVCDTAKVRKVFAKPCTDSNEALMTQFVTPFAVDRTLHHSWSLTAGLVV